MNHRIFSCTHSNYSVLWIIHRLTRETQRKIGAKVQSDLFTYLVIGLLSHERTEIKYPYSDVLRYALNRLAAAMLQQGRRYPVTITAALELFHEPLKQWWPEATLPQSIDDEFPLLYNGSLDEQAIEHLDDIPGAIFASLQEIEAVLNNQAIEELIQALREIYHKQPQRAQQAYIKVRQFLIQHPHTTNQELIRQLSDLREVDFALIQRMYEPADGNSQLMYEGRHWQCPHCHGVLRWSNSRPRCAKPSVCGRLYPDYAGRQPIKPNPDLLVLRWSIHARTCIPGLREIALFEELTSSKYSGRLDVILWPGIDRYDMQVRFSDDEKWAIDVKDYKNPYQLGQKIATDTLYDAEQELRWHQGYYVIPFYRTEHFAADGNYLQKVTETVGKLKERTALLDEAGFKRAIDDRLKRLQH
jgi:hypothetical protein